MIEGVFVFIFGFFIGARVATVINSDKGKEGGAK